MRDGSDDWMGVLRTSEAHAALGRVGSYELLEEVGRGGQGVVYRAREDGTQRIVAIKRLIEGQLSGERARRRFEREIEILSRLRHPGIVTANALDAPEALPTLVMDWVDGVSITEWCRDELREVELAPRLERFLEVCDAMQYAHQNGVLHRDLKPGNILVDRSGSVRVLDFGAARSVEPDEDGLTASLEFLGTPNYASPEQLIGANGLVDTRSDIYSLGVLLYEMLTGQLPIERDYGLPVFFDQKRRDAVDPPSTKSAGLSRAVDAVVLKCLAQDAQDRYQSVAALGEDVRRLLAGDPVSAHLPGLVDQLRRFVRHNRALTVLVVLLLASLGTTAGVALWYSGRVADERDEALVQARRGNAYMGVMTSAIAAGAAGVLERDMTIIDTLEIAIDQAEKSLGGDVALEAELRSQFADALVLLRERHKAREQAAAVMALTHESDRARWAKSASTYCQLSLKLNIIDGVAAVCDEVYATLGEIDDSLIKAEILCNLSSCSNSQGQVAEAERLAREGLALTRQVEGPRAESLSTAAIFELCEALETQGSYAEALAFYEQQLEEVVRHLPPDRTDEVLLRVRKLEMEAKLGLCSEAERTAELRRLLPSADAIRFRAPGVPVGVRRDIASAIYATDPGEGTRLFREALAMAEELVGVASPSYVAALRDYSLAAGLNGEFELALEVRREVLGLYLDLSGVESNQSINARAWVGSYLHRLGRMEEARDELELACAQAEALNPPDYLMYYLPRHMYASLLADLGERDQALELAYATLADLRGVTRPSEVRVLEMMGHWEAFFQMLDDTEGIALARQEMDERRSRGSSGR